MAWTCNTQEAASNTLFLRFASHHRCQHQRSDLRELTKLVSLEALRGPKSPKWLKTLQKYLQWRILRSWKHPPTLRSLTYSIHAHPWEVASCTVWGRANDALRPLPKPTCPLSKEAQPTPLVAWFKWIKMPSHLVKAIYIHYKLLKASNLLLKLHQACHPQLSQPFSNSNPKVVLGLINYTIVKCTSSNSTNK